jgi:ribokinase
MTGRHDKADENAVGLTVVGSVNLDLVARSERLPRVGETLTDATFARYPGGKGANQAVVAARLGASVRFVGAVGADDFAEAALAGMREAGVALELGQGDTTGVAVILVDDQGENVIVVAPGANLQVGPVESGGSVLSQLEVSDETVASAAEGAERFFLNAAPARPVPASVVRAAELVVVNRYELDSLPETPALLALTLGEEGAVLIEGGQEVARAAAPRVRALDGTAAGDAFTACLVVSLLEERDREEALRRACAAGAIAASRPGGQPSLPTATEVDAMLRS